MHHPHLDVHSNNLVYLTELPVSFGWRELKTKAEKDFGSVRFVESFEAWLFRPSGRMVLDFRSPKNAVAFADAVLSGRFGQAARCRCIQDVGRAKFFNRIKDDTGVDLLACGGVPPFHDWAKNRRRDTTSPTESSSSSSSSSIVSVPCPRKTTANRFEPYSKPSSVRQFLWDTNSGNQHLLSVPCPTPVNGTSSSNLLAALPLELRSLQLKLLTLLGPPPMNVPPPPLPLMSMPMPLAYCSPQPQPARLAPVPLAIAAAQFSDGPPPTIPLSKSPIFRHDESAREGRRHHGRTTTDRQRRHGHGLHQEMKRRRSPAAPKPQRRRKQRWDVRPEELDHDDEKDTNVIVLDSDSSSDSDIMYITSHFSSKVKCEEKGIKLERCQEQQEQEKTTVMRDEQMEQDRDEVEEDEDDEQDAKEFGDDLPEWDEFELLEHGVEEMEERQRAEKEQQQKQKEQQQQQKEKSPAEVKAEPEQDDDEDAEMERLLCGNGYEDEAEELDVSPAAVRILLGDAEEAEERERKPDIVAALENGSVAGGAGGERVMVESIRRMSLNEQGQKA